jgi:Ser/Thr protein kinase RdoA (MazF antagonist)
MSFESVVHTTLSARAVAEFAVTVFDFQAPPIMRLLSRGFNDVYAIEVPERLFLRVGRQARRTLIDVELEARALAEAKAAGASVAVALLGRDGRFAQRLEAPEGERAALLFAAAPGSDAEDTPGHAHAQGRALARLHDVVLTASTAHGMRRLDVETLVNEPVERASGQLRNRPELAARLREIATGMREHLERVQAGLSIGLCHGDCHGYNATVDREVATLLDFDEAGIGWIAYDLATFLRTCHVVSPASRRPLWTNFVAGYRSLRIPAAADMEALETLVIVRELWTLGAWAEGAPHWGDQWFHSTHFARRLEELGERFERLTGPRLT